ncbi:hypothetical protein FB451DRAFT_1407784 [Mycena latifolia]|nr:hypothetical protein FB451DRAFT_1407784 [Mycena latifolia]
MHCGAWLRRVRGEQALDDARSDVAPASAAVTPTSCIAVAMRAKLRLRHTTTSTTTPSYTPLTASTPSRLALPLPSRPSMRAWYDLVRVHDDRLDYRRSCSCPAPPLAAHRPPHPQVAAASASLIAHVVSVASSHASTVFAARSMPIHPPLTATVRTISRMRSPAAPVLHPARPILRLLSPTTRTFRAVPPPLDASACRVPPTRRAPRRRQFSIAHTAALASAPSAAPIFREGPPAALAARASHAVHRCRHRPDGRTRPISTLPTLSPFLSFSPFTSHLPPPESVRVVLR